MLCFRVSPSLPSEALWQWRSGGRRRRDAVSVRGEADKHHKALWWWSECECRSHTFKKSWCSLSLRKSHTSRTQGQIVTTSIHIHTQTHARTHTNASAHDVTYCILNLAHSQTEWAAGGAKVAAAECRVNNPASSAPSNSCFYIWSSTLIWNIKDWHNHYRAIFTRSGNNSVHGTTIHFSVDGAKTML